MAVHRLVYELLVGPVPGDLELDHLCRITRCCNPDHLEPVTHAENTRRYIGARSGWLTTADVAEMLGVAQNTVSRWVRLDYAPRRWRQESRGAPPRHYRFGHAVRFHRNDIARYITERTEVAS